MVICNIFLIWNMTPFDERRHLLTVKNGWICFRSITWFRSKPVFLRSGFLKFQREVTGKVLVRTRNMFSRMTGLPDFDKSHIIEIEWRFDRFFPLYGIGYTGYPTDNKTNFRVRLETFPLGLPFTILRIHQASSEKKVSN